MNSTHLPTIHETSELLLAGRTSSRALVDACLARIDQFEDRIRAWVLVDAEGARRQAAERDAELQAGRCRGPLHGVPIGIKDIIDVAGWPTLAGSRLRLGNVATRDAQVVTRLREAGAVFLGKTVTTEFASFDPSPTRNPWNLTRTPAGSSSGSAAAVALGMCVAAMGSQTGGSITRPAAYCGVAGCKPTYGRVSLTGILPLSFHLDHPGPLARDVADLAIMLTAIAGYDPQDAISIDIPTANYTAEPARCAPPRLAVLTGFFNEAAAPDVRESLEAALGKLAAAGATIERVAPPDSFAPVIAYHRSIMAIDAAMHHRDNFPERRAEYGPCIAALMDEGLATTLVDYSAALAHQRRFARDLELRLAGYDALVTPSATTTAPGLETTGDPRFQAPFSYAGLPTVCFPCGLSSANEMPVSFQLIGSRWGEGALLSVSQWCEATIGFSAQPPLLAEGAPVG
ncbi:MAG TPA: amidase [Pirellulales bacterium]|nr:amidase [Pirellulales bacterium]